MMVDPDARTRMSESKPDPFVGKSFDGYRIDSVIGRGGMGSVYLATQLSLGRPVAIKVLTGELAQDPQFLSRFHREADVLSKLSHPNVVTVFDRGEVEGRPYLVMEYIEGTSLRDILRGGPCRPEEALRIVSSVLSALAHAHEKGIVHRDIKPENVLLARGDVVKVADFGLSRLLGPQEQTRLTRTHLVLGTYEYMAPEQREHAREADERSDLYATGVVLYEMLVGELPIGRFHLPSRARPGECDSRIDKLIERSLNKDPEERYQDASSFAGAVSAILERPSAPPRPSPPPLPPRPAGASVPSEAYRPARFEYHCDNVATIDHVLGTICYVFGVLALFGAGFTRMWLPGVHFILLFVAGWYLRETAEELRKYKRGARTSQAVIAIVCAFTGFLLPFSIYSLWVLFGHRGRTYFEARARGLDEQDAARYTYRLLEEPYGKPVPQPPPLPKAPPPPTPPTPSRIPVQSIVTSEVLEPEEEVFRPRLSRLVKAGIAVSLFTLIFGGVALWADAPHEDIIVPLGIVTAVSIVLLIAGLFHAAFSKRARGAVPAVVALVALVGGSAYCHEYSWNRYWHPNTVEMRIGQYSRLPPLHYEQHFFDDLKRTAWLQEATGYDGSLAEDIVLERRGNSVWAVAPRRLREITLSTVRHALRHVIKVERGREFMGFSIVGNPSPSSFYADYQSRNPFTR